MDPYRSSDDYDDHLPATHTTAVAIDKDKNSHFAVKWAVDHLLINNPRIVLIHVRTRNMRYCEGSGSNENSPEANRQQSDSEMQQIFLSYSGFCARKKIQMKEVVLDDTDISKALVDYVKNNRINNIVLGASTRNAFTRKFRNPDVPTCLNKSAPDFCTVYVISKGKVATFRSATRTAPTNAAPPRQPSRMGFRPDYSDPEDSIKSPFAKGRRSGGSKRSAARSMGAVDIQSIDFTAENLEFSLTSESPSSSIFSQSSMEAEMKRLKLELKQTMEMYSTACKEALQAKQKAQELHQWKMEERRRFEEAKLAKGEALAMAEAEKAKCKAATEAAKAAQRLAELEAQRRKNLEMKVKHDAEETEKVLDYMANNEIRSRKYSIGEIQVATDSFSDSLKIGEGGYGPVYRGTLDQTPVAIKVLRSDVAQGRKQFQQEVEVLSCIRHPNIVLLLGACPESGCLVYEYMYNGSLEDRLFRMGDTPTIPWRTRFKIATEIATGLLFLHQTKPEPFVHRDLKPANILLDHNYVSKISDVGLARLVPPSVADSITQYHMTTAAGTFCYIDPEYQQTGMLGTKSDIYSFGIMLLQIITAKSPMGLSHYVERSIEKGTFETVLDPTVPDWPVEEALSYARMALKCAELQRKDRPDLKSDILPELNRLSNLGNSEASNISSDSYGPRSYDVNSHPTVSHPTVSDESGSNVEQSQRENST